MCERGFAAIRFVSPIFSFWELWERYGGLGERPGGLQERQEAYGKKSLPQFSPKSWKSPEIDAQGFSGARARFIRTAYYSKMAIFMVPGL